MNLYNLPDPEDTEDVTLDETLIDQEAETDLDEQDDDLAFEDDEDDEFDPEDLDDDI